MFFEDYMELTNFNKDVMEIDIPMVIISGAGIGINAVRFFGEFTNVTRTPVIVVLTFEEECHKGIRGFVA